MNIIRPVTITDSVLTSSNVPETDAAEFLIGTSYALDDEVMVTTNGVHSIYISLQAANQGNQPEDDDLVAPVFWARKSATNQWAMFSSQINDQTELADEIIVVFDAASLVDGMAFFNVDAQSITIVMDDPVDGIVYNETLELIDNSGVADWFAWYFEPIVIQDTAGVLDLPPYSNATITVTITNTGSTAKCGVITFGAQRQLGITDHGTGIGIVDYSRKERDTFGNPVIVRRNFAKRGNYAVTANTGYVGTIQQTLSGLRTVNMAWIGSVDFPSTIIFGYYKDFDVILSNPRTSQLSIEVEGLT